MTNKKILFIVNHLAFFVSHRMWIAEELKRKNNTVKIISGSTASLSMEKIAMQEIKKKKIDFQKLSYSSSKINILRDLVGIFRLILVIKKFNPDVIHFVSAKALLIGIIGSYFSKIRKRVVSISGVGNFFIEKKILSKIIKFFYIKIVLLFKDNNLKFIVQNNRDQKLIQKNFHLKKKNIFLIKGSGVDSSTTKPSNINQRKKIVLFPARAVKEKGIIEFIYASNYLKKKFPQWKFIIAGTLDYKGPGEFSENELIGLKKNRNIIFSGYQKNLSKLFRKTSIVCLPSYNEGLSKSLIEALFMRIPIVTSNVPGCRELVKNYKTGFLVPPRNKSILVKKLEKLIINKKIRFKMTKNYRLFDTSLFEKKTIIKKHLKLYNSLY